MKLFVALVCVLLLAIGIVCGETFSSEPNTEHGIQILSPTKNHTYLLEFDELNRVLNAPEIRDRHVVVVSIAGAFRQGKSFLLNFFLKYLYAQVKIQEIFIYVGI